MLRQEQQNLDWMNKVTKESEQSIMTKNLKIVTRDGGMEILAISRKCKMSGRCKGYNELCLWCVEIRLPGKAILMERNPDNGRSGTGTWDKIMDDEMGHNEAWRRLSPSSSMQQSSTLQSWKAPGGIFLLTWNEQHCCHLTDEVSWSTKRLDD